MTLNGNPTLRRVVRNSENGKYASEYGNVATVKSMAWKSVALCAATVVAAVVTALLLYHFIDTANFSALGTLFTVLAVSTIPLIIIAIVIMFAPQTAGILGFIYCILQGISLGTVSAIVDIFFPGISFAAFIGTCIVFFVAWAVFGILGKRLSNSFVKFVLISFISIVLLEGICYILSLFIPMFAAIMSNIWVQLAISAVMILWATFMIMVDLNSMHRLAESGADKKYEWLAAFSLVTTLIWLYLEILEMLVRLILIAISRNN